MPFIPTVAIAVDAVKQCKWSCYHFIDFVYEFKFNTSILVQGNSTKEQFKLWLATKISNIVNHANTEGGKAGKGGMGHVSQREKSRFTIHVS